MLGTESPTSRYKRKVLFVATVDVHILSFHIPYLKMLQEMGYETHVATNGHGKIPFCDKRHTICMERSPFKVKNIAAIRQMKKLLEKENFDIVHCHTPMGGVVARLASKQVRNHGTRIIYTAHGFHFYKGAPLINWLLFYPVEKYLAKYTDVLITINREDYSLAKKKFYGRCHDIQYIPGVGLDVSRFNFEMSEQEKNGLRESLNIRKDDFILIYVAELSRRKNQLWLIRSLASFLTRHQDTHLLLVGHDSLKHQCHKMIQKLSIDKQVHCLDFRDDVPKLLKIADLAISSSKQEGLPINLVEAAYSGLPILASDCRGNRDLVKNGINGYLVDRNAESLLTAISKIYHHKVEFKKNAKHNKAQVQTYILSKVLPCYAEIYSKNGGQPC